MSLDIRLLGKAALIVSIGLPLIVTIGWIIVQTIIMFPLSPIIFVFAFLVSMVYHILVEFRDKNLPKD